MRDVRSLLVATLLIPLLSGCITAGSFDEGEDPPEATTSAPTIIVRSDTETATMPAGAAVMGSNDAPLFEVAAPAGVLDMRLVLERDLQTTELRVDVEEADGDTTQHDWTGERLVVELDEPGVGTTKVRVSATANPKTELTLHSTVRWTQDEGGLEEAVRVVRVGDAYRAEIVYAADHKVGQDVAAEVDLFNGDIEIIGSSDDGNASATVTTWARAASEARARTLVLDMVMQLAIEDAKLTAIVEDKTDRRDSEGIGATGRFVVPATVSGLFDTSNGRFTLEGVRAKDLMLDTSNGKVTGSIAAEGRLAIDTSNGEIDLGVDPTGTLRFDLDTSNGDVDLRLNNDAQHSYDLDVDTSNGKVTESMDGHSFKATDDDEDEGSLKADGGKRAIHTTGVVDTSNGDVHFAAA